MATYNNIKKIKIGDNIFNLYDSGNSGGTITSVKTTAGAHTAIDVTSGTASFNVPTKTSHLTNDSGFINGNTGGIFYGTCSTSGDAIAKIVECSAFTSADLIEGAIILVHFENTNNGAVTDLTMNVNNTGAKAIKYINNGTLINIPSVGHLKADTSYFFVYDGTHWVAMYNFNSTYTSMSSGEAKAGTATSARSITAARLKEAILTHAPVTSINGETGDVTISVPQNASDVGAVPTSRTVNNKALSSDISLNASDVGAVPTTRTVNGKALSANIADADYITEEGNKAVGSITWTYRRTHKGDTDAWATVSWSSVATSVWSSPVRYKDLTISIPSGIFSAAPRITATSTSTQYWVAGVTVSSATSATIRFATVATSNFAFQAYVYAFGS